MIDIVYYLLVALCFTPLLFGVFGCYMIYYAFKTEELISKVQLLEIEKGDETN